MYRLILLVLCCSLGWGHPAHHAGPAEKPLFALALGGGAALGYTHLGVLQVLEEQGMTPDLVVGASMGSIVGGYYCAGVPMDRIIKEAGKLNIFKLMDWKLGGLGFFEWKKVRKRMKPLLGHVDFADCSPSLICVATDLMSGERVGVSSGPLLDGMLASATVPGLYRPVELDGRLLVDGGLVDEVPVITAREAGAGIVVAVDVSHPLLGKEMNGPFDVMRQAYFIIQMHNVDHRNELADLMIRPDLESLDFHRFGQVELAIERGRQAALERLPELRTLLMDRGWLAAETLQPDEGRSP